MDRINGARTIDIGGGRRGFVGQNKAAGIAGTEVTSAYMNGLQEELLAIILDAGLAPDAADWTQLLQALGRYSRIVPQAGVSLYIRSDGNDANDGSTNDAAGAFRTLDAAVAFAQQFGGAGKPIELVLGMPGDYQAPEIPPGSRFKIRSTGAAADHVLTNAAGPRAVLSSSQTFLELADVALRNTQPGFNTLRADTGASIILTGTVTIASPINPGLACITATNGGTVRGIGVLTISQSAQSALSADKGSFLFDNTSQINFPGGPSYGDAVAVAINGGAIVLAPGVVRTGAALGKRYRVDTNGVINTSGAGINFFPGDVAGTVANGGVYV